MGTRSRSIVSRTGLMPALVGIVLVYALSVWAQAGGASLRSPDGKYQAILVGSGNDVHYQVKDVDTDRVVLTTTAQYRTPNDVKIGLFSPDSKEFGAAYHYGHSGSYTWIGIWRLEDGNLVHTERKNGWITDIASVFKK